MKFEGIERVRLKLVDVDLRVSPWDRDYVELSPRSETGIKTRVRDGRLSVDYKAVWKLGKTIKRDRTLEPLELRVPEGVPVSVGMKRGQLTAEGVHFESLVVGECRVSLNGCTIGELISAASTVRGSISVEERASVMTMAGTVELAVEMLDGDLKIASNMGLVRICLSQDCDASITTHNNGGVVRLDGIDPEEPVIGDGSANVTLVANMGGVAELTICGDDEDDL